LLHSYIPAIDDELERIAILCRSVIGRDLLGGLGSVLQKVPDDYKPLAAVLVGSVILVAIVLFHGTGLHGIIVGQDRWRARLSARHPHLTGAALVFGWGVFLMLFLQILEILIWALALNRLGLIKNAHDTIYFCANAYTTLGMGKMELDRPWRLISPIIGISGLFTFAWTTSVLVDMVTAHRQFVEQLRAQRTAHKKAAKTTAQ